MAAPEPPVLVVTGPTAAGKTDLALRLHDLLPVRLISVDSAQIFRGLDIGSAKPGLELRARYPHALIDLLEPTESFSAAEFVAAADREVEAAQAAGQVPVLVGGTMLYLRAFREGLAELPPADAELRRRISERAERQGWGHIHRVLQEVDPIAAQQIHPNNPQRLQRAMEVYELTGRPISHWWRQHAGRSAEQRHGRRLLEFAVLPESRAWLHDRIARRFDAMLAAGFLDEVRGLKARGDLSLDLPAMRAVGYRQAWQYLDGEPEDPAAFRERAIAATRQLAKRQLTWLRRWPQVRALDPADPAEQALAVLAAAGLAN